MITHRCRCGVDYECLVCTDHSSWVCPTLNGDENAHQCSDCEAKIAKEYQEWHDEHLGHGGKMVIVNSTNPTEDELKELEYVTGLGQ